VKIRIATAIAFVIGYTLGARARARAGRRRYEQITRAVTGVGRTARIEHPVTLVSDKTRAVAALTVERVKDTVGVRLGWRDGDEAADAIAVDLAEDLALAINSRRHLSPRRVPGHRGAEAARR
jgi:hypothetical protein